MARRKKTQAQPVTHPAPPFGPWSELEDASDFEICAVHRRGINPGGSCLACRLERLEGGA